MAIDWTAFNNLRENPILPTAQAGEFNDGAFYHYINGTGVGGIDQRYTDQNLDQFTDPTGYAAFIAAKQAEGRKQALASLNVGPEHAQTQSAVPLDGMTKEQLDYFAPIAARYGFTGDLTKNTGWMKFVLGDGSVETNPATGERFYVYKPGTSIMQQIGMTQFPDAAQQNKGTIGELLGKYMPGLVAGGMLAGGLGAFGDLGAGSGALTPELSSISSEAASWGGGIPTAADLAGGSAYTGIGSLSDLAGGGAGLDNVGSAMGDNWWDSLTSEFGNAGEVADITPYSDPYAGLGYSAQDISNLQNYLGLDSSSVVPGYESLMNQGGILQRLSDMGVPFNVLQNLNISQIRSLGQRLLGSGSGSVGSGTNQGNSGGGLFNSDGSVNWGNLLGGALGGGAALAYNATLPSPKLGEYEQLYAKAGDTGGILGKYDLDSATGRGLLNSSLSSRGILGSSFGDQALTNYDTTRGIGRGALGYGGVSTQLGTLNSLNDAIFKNNAVKTGQVGRLLGGVANAASPSTTTNNLSLNLPSWLTGWV